MYKKRTASGEVALFGFGSFVIHDPVAALVLQRRERRALLKIGLFLVVAHAVLVVRLVVAGHGHRFARSEFLHTHYLHSHCAQQHHFYTRANAGRRRGQTNAGRKAHIFRPKSIY